MELERRNEHNCFDDVTVHVLVFIHFMVTIHWHEEGAQSLVLGNYLIGVRSAWSSVLEQHWNERCLEFSVRETT